MTGRIHLDMHTHTGYSRDSRTPIAAQAAAIKAAGLDVVCATDHDTIDGALRLRELAEGFRVVVGEEISSADGDLIGLFLVHAIPPGLSGEETIERVHDQGGIVSVPHPFSRNRRHRIRTDALSRIWRHVDCIEVFNAREALAGDNRRAAAFAAEKDLPGAVGSDAHRPWELGRAYAEVDDFRTPDELLRSLRSARIEGRLSGLRAHLFTRYDTYSKRLWRRGQPPE